MNIWGADAVRGVFRSHRWWSRGLGETVWWVLPVKGGHDDLVRGGVTWFVHETSWRRSSQGHSRRDFFWSWGARLKAQGLGTRGVV